jgi:hypothetical protein
VVTGGWGGSSCGWRDAAAAVISCAAMQPLTLLFLTKRKSILLFQTISSAFANPLVVGTPS